MDNNSAILTITLDFELYWGVRHSRNFAEYRDNILGVRAAVPDLLKLFSEYQIHATWATVGFLFFETLKELEQGCPDLRPQYLEQKFNHYPHLQNIGGNETEDPYHFAPSLIRQIIATPNQEIGCHTFCHYFCLEKGQDGAAFRQDLGAFKSIAEKYHLKIDSLVFPANQVNAEYLPILQEIGIKAFRGNGLNWSYRANCWKERKNPVARGLRFLDGYFNLFGHNSYPLASVTRSLPYNLPASRFLRPYSKSLRLFEPLRLQRILSSMTYAAKTGQVYHLYWHPENFGVNLAENLLFLKRIFEHFQVLQDKYGMTSLTLSEIAARLNGGWGD